jgi:hypothetical protein
MSDAALASWMCSFFLLFSPSSKHSLQFLLSYITPIIFYYFIRKGEGEREREREEELLNGA